MKAISRRTCRQDRMQRYFRKQLDPIQIGTTALVSFLMLSLRDTYGGFTRFGGDLLSHVLRRSTIGAKALNGWVRDGTRCFALAMTTKPRKASVSRVCVVQIRDTRCSIFRKQLCPSHVQLCMCMLLIIFRFFTCQGTI